MKLRLINLFLLSALQTLCFSLPVQALNETFLETIKLDESFLSIEPRSQILYLEDNQHTLQKEDILNSEHFEWLALPNPSANFGFSDSVFWLKFSLQNTGQRLQELYLHIDYALLDKINVYQVNGNKLLSAFDSGDHLPFQNRPVPFPTFLFPINIESGSTSNVYIRIETQGTLQAPISIWNKDYFLL
ncbi:MAG: hypothetical protein ACJAS1_006170, partial [Oleiphilaceae bacterium]